MPFPVVSAVKPSKHQKTSYPRRQTLLAWGAKVQVCPKCHSDPFETCWVAVFWSWTLLTQPPFGPRSVCSCWQWSRFLGWEITSIHPKYAKSILVALWIQGTLPRNLERSSASTVPGIMCHGNSAGIFSVRNLSLVLGSSWTMCKLLFVIR